MKTGNRLLWERDNIGKDPGFFGERTEYGFPVLVRIMRHRSASPAKSQAFPQLGKAEPARFLGKKFPAVIFCLKPVGLERDTVRLPSYLQKGLGRRSVP